MKFCTAYIESFMGSHSKTIVESVWYVMTFWYTLSTALAFSKQWKYSLRSLSLYLSFTTFWHLAHYTEEIELCHLWTLVIIILSLFVYKGICRPKKPMSKGIYVDFFFVWISFSSTVSITGNIWGVTYLIRSSCECESIKWIVWVVG